MANEINRKIRFHRPVFKDGKYAGTEPNPERVDEHSMHWNPEDECFEIWTEGDVCVEDGIYTYVAFEFDLTVEEVRRLHNAMSDWLVTQVPGLGVYTIQFRDVLIDDGDS